MDIIFWYHGSHIMALWRFGITEFYMAEIIIKYDMNSSILAEIIIWYEFINSGLCDINECYLCISSLYQHITSHTHMMVYKT